MGVRLGSNEKQLHLPPMTWQRAGVMLMVGVLVALLYMVGSLADDQAADHKLIAELIQHEADQVDLLCDKGVYVGKETCDGSR